MAENDEAQEKTEDATPRRLEKAREEGQIARSRELATTMILVGGAVGLWMFGASLVERFGRVMQLNLNFSRQSAMDPAQMFSHLSLSFLSVVGIVAMLLSVMLVMGILANLLLGGWLVSAKPLAPRIDRLNPISGLKRMFSVKSLVELFKALAKFLLVASVAVAILLGFQGQLLDLGREPLHTALSHATSIILLAALGLSAVTILIAAIDVPFQQFEHKKQLKMTRQQVRDELKDVEGKPEVRGRIRQIQRQLANARMMADLPEADVVITNPEHFAVALKYNTADAMSELSVSRAPILIAKGADQIAFKIREVADHHKIPVVQSQALARAIFFSTELDQEIPEKLYLSVAQVLAFIHQIKAKHRNRFEPNGSDLRSLDQKLEIPSEMIFDQEGGKVDTGPG